MARRGGGEGVSAGPMNTIIAGFIGLLVIVAIVVLGPVLAGSIQSSVPNLSASSQWNGSFNTNIPSGVAVWTTNVTIGAVVIQLCAGKRIKKYFDNLLMHLMYSDVKSSSSSHWRSWDFMGLKTYHPVETISGLSHNLDIPLRGQCIGVRPCAVDM
jgi:hypothetical protein